MAFEKINTTNIQANETNVNWIANGEKANEAVLNRPAKEVAEIVNANIDAFSDEVQTYLRQFGLGEGPAKTYSDWNAIPQDFGGFIALTSNAANRPSGFTYTGFLHITAWGDNNNDSYIAKGVNANKIFFLSRQGNGTFIFHGEFYHTGNDGAGSGLNADQVDGIEASQFARRDQANTMSNFLTLHADPVNDLHAATKKYVDTVAQGLDLKESVRIATTANITLSGHQDIDGVTTSNGMRVLVKNQTDKRQNGIYVASSGAWARAEDADGNPQGEVTTGMFTFVEGGVTNQSRGFVLATVGNIVLGTTNLTFVQFSGAGQIEAGTGIVKNGDTLSFDQSYGDGRYVRVGGKAADSDKLDGLNSTQFLRSDQNDTMNGSLTVTSSIISNGAIISGLGSGGVAMTVNDGYGNANLTFNHNNGRPEQAGNSGRITVNTDDANNATMAFGLAQGVPGDGSITPTQQRMALTEQYLNVNTLNGMRLDNNREVVLGDGSVRIVGNGANSTYESNASIFIKADKNNSSTNERLHLYAGVNLLRISGGSSASASALTFNGAQVLTTASGKSVDSDKLDGLNSSQFLRSDANDTQNGGFTVTNGFIRFESPTLQLQHVNSDGGVAELGYEDDWLRYRFGGTSLARGLRIDNYDNVAVQLQRDGASTFNYGVDVVNYDLTVRNGDAVLRAVNYAPNQVGGLYIRANNSDTSWASQRHGIFLKSDSEGSSRVSVDASDVEVMAFSSATGATALNGLRVSGGTLDMNNNDIVGVDAIIHEGDSNTYMQFHGADKWRVVTGGAQQLEVNNSSVIIDNTLDLNGRLDAYGVNHSNIIRIDDNNANQDLNAINIDYNVSGSQKLSQTRYHHAQRIDVDFTANGDQTNGENRVYGHTIDVDVNVGGRLRRAYGLNSDVRSSADSGNAFQLIGALNSADNETRGDANINETIGSYSVGYFGSTSSTNSVSLYGAWNTAVYSGNATAYISSMLGSRNEVQIDNNTVTSGTRIGNIYCTQSVIDQNDADEGVKANNAYLFWGQYEGTAANNQFGVYINNDVPSLFKGEVIVENTQPWLQLNDTTGDNMKIRNQSGVLYFDNGTGVGNAVLDTGPIRADSLFLSDSSGPYVYQSNATHKSFSIRTGVSGSYKYLTFRGDNGDLEVGGQKVWHNGNDGPGSGLHADLLDGYNATTSSEANTVAVRNGSADIHARLFRSTYGTQGALSADSDICFRINNSNDNFMRFVTRTGFANYLEGEGRFATKSTTKSNSLGDSAWIAAYVDADNRDHIWHDEANNTWNFVSDSPFKSTGNSTLRAGGIISNGLSKFSGRVMFAGDGNHNNQNANIAVAVGDADTGLRWNSDGNMDIMANNQAVINVQTNACSINKNTTFDNGTNTIVDIKGNDDGIAELRLYGDSQGTGRLYVGQSLTHGGGIEYNGDNSPSTSGAGLDYITLYRRNSNTDSWTARNRFDSNNWEFRGDITAFSDERLKDNFEVVDNALDKIGLITGYTFDRTDTEYKCRQAGFKAQDVQKVLPEVVNVGKDEMQTLSLDYGKMGALYVQAIKELKSENDELKAKVSSMEESMSSMEELLLKLAKEVEELKSK